MKYRVIGLMSGTSMDGLDIAFCKFELNQGKWSFLIEFADTIPYSQKWLDDLNTARDLTELELSALDLRYGKYLAIHTQEFIEKHKIENVEYISSHGHTIHHKPEEGITVQIGNGKIFSQIIGMPVINDFRTQDVKLGGQGAPLVPIGDQLLFEKYAACLNLGGFANISFKVNNQMQAFDICPANIVLNKISSRLNLLFDENGRLAKSGNLNLSLFQSLNANPYYGKDYPKSLGIEWVEKEIYPLIDEEVCAEDLLHTFVHHIIFQLKKVIDKYEIENILVTGGGAFNDYLIAQWREKCSANIILPESKIINYKEALVFAFLGVLKLRKENNVLKSVTGSKIDHCSGVLCGS